MKKTKKTSKKACVLVSGIPDLSKIHTTAADIRNGKVGDPQYCAIALSVRRALKGMDIADLNIDGSSDYVEVAVNIPEPQVCVAGKLVPLSSVTGDDYESAQKVRIDLNLVGADDFIEQFDGWKDGEVDDDNKPLWKRPRPQTFKASPDVTKAW